MYSQKIIKWTATYHVHAVYDFESMNELKVNARHGH